MGLFFALLSNYFKVDFDVTLYALHLMNIAIFLKFKKEKHTPNQINNLRY